MEKEIKKYGEWNIITIKKNYKPIKIFLARDWEYCAREIINEIKDIKGYEQMSDGKTVTFVPFYLEDEEREKAEKENGEATWYSDYFTNYVLYGLIHNNNNYGIGGIKISKNDCESKKIIKKYVENIGIENFKELICDKKNTLINIL